MLNSKATIALAFATAIPMAIASPSAHAIDIYTGEASGAYYKDFCPRLKNAIADKNLNIQCKTSKGTLDNLEKIIKTPANFALGQFDLFSAEYTKEANKLSFSNVRDDIGTECLFLVSKNKLMTNYGDIIASSEHLNFVLPPEKSGHTGTFKYLQKIDPDGLGKASNISYAASTEDAITEALSSEDNITLFVQHPNAENPVFKLVTENGGHFIPVLSKAILSEEAGGRKVYTAQQTDVVAAKWIKSGNSVITACTPIILFTGKAARVSEDSKKTEHDTAIEAFQNVPSDKLRPEQSWFSKLWSGTKSLSGKTVESLVEATEKAKKASSPYISKAKEKTKDAMEAAKPTLEKAKEATKDAYEVTKEKTKEAIKAAKPTYEKAKEATKDAYEKAKPTLKKAQDATIDAYEKAKKKVGEMIDDNKASDDATIDPDSEATKMPDEPSKIDPAPAE